MAAPAGVIIFAKTVNGISIKRSVIGTCVSKQAIQSYSASVKCVVEKL